MAYIIIPLADRSKSFVKALLHFVEKIDGLNIPDNTVMVSFDMKSFSSSVPILEALHVIRKRLELDTTVISRTSLGIRSIMELLYLCLTTTCLTTTYFTYEGQYYQQNDRVAMGSPLSPIVANIYMYMEHFKEMALETADEASLMWLKYVDNTFSLRSHGTEEISQFLGHINNIQPSIQFTMEVHVEDNKLPFVEVLTVRDNNILKSEVY